MNNLAVGIELLFTGMLTTFLVLVFLLFLMKATSALINKQSAPEKEPAAPEMKPATPAPRAETVAAVPSEDLATDELVAIMTALGMVLPANHKAVVRVAPPSTTGVGEEELVAAIVGAMAAR